MITIIYKVEVSIPDDVFDLFTSNDNREYNQATIAATKGYIEAGTETYTNPPIEYATFYDKGEALNCESMLEKVMITFQQLAKSHE